MSDFSIYNEYGPITWYKRRPIYLTTILIGVFFLGMVATVFITAAKSNPYLFAFSPGYFWGAKYLWQVATYPLLAGPSLYFIIGMLFFYWVGVETERYLGRPRYVRLLVLLTLTPPAVLSAFYLSGADGVSAGSNAIISGVFIACATLYPNMEYWGVITMKWLAVAGMVFYSLFYIMYRDMVGLTVFLSVCAVGFAYVRYLQLGGEMPSWLGNLFKRKPKFRVVRADEAGGDVHESIDPLLDKISKTGIGSLTAKEKEQLQRARKSLLKREE